MSLALSSLRPWPVLFRNIQTSDGFEASKDAKLDLKTGKNKQTNKQARQAIRGTFPSDQPRSNAGFDATGVTRGQVDCYNLMDSSSATVPKSIKAPVLLSSSIGSLSWNATHSGDMIGG